MIKVVLLADYLTGVPTLAQWFRAQWPIYFAGRSLTDIAADFHQEANRSGLPLRLVALVDGTLAGTIVLREQATNHLPAFRPGLGGLYVDDPHRGIGVGTTLVQAGMDVAREQGFQKLYATTVAAGGILTRLGWTLLQPDWHQDEQFILYECEL